MVTLGWRGRGRASGSEPERAGVKGVALGLAVHAAAAVDDLAADIGGKVTREE